MNRILFFDDSRLFGRENMERDYGKPQYLSEFFDNKVSTDYRTPFVFKTADGKFRMIYSGKKIVKKQQDENVFSLEGFSVHLAVSDDGIHFTPEKVESDIPKEKKVADNQIMSLGFGQEVAEIICDESAPQNERYKMLFTSLNVDKLIVEGCVKSSPDLKKWQLFSNKSWNGIAEPVTGVFKKNDNKTFGILVRFDWGERKVGYTETKDFKSYTKKVPCIQCDSEDEPLAELYGMPAFNYNGIYIGFPILYSNNKSSYSVKYFGGTIYSQLAYSFDGSHWQRSLRKNFIDNNTAKTDSKMIWISSVYEKPDGDLLIYTGETPFEHGCCDKEPGKGRVKVYSLRKDGFICLKTRGKGSVLTRELFWQGDKLHINLKAKKATVAVYTSDIGGDVRGKLTLAKGFSHDDCIEFSGDCKDWVPQFKNGKSLADFVGKTMAFEIKINDGEIYSLSGDFIPISSAEAARYRALGKRPKNTIRF